MYAKSELYAERYNEYGDDRVECIWLKVRCTNKIVYFSCVYRPPNSEMNVGNYSTKVWKRQKITVIRIYLTNAPIMIIKHGVLDPLCSDHKPIYSALNIFCST